MSQPTALSGHVRPPASALQAYKISLPEEVLDAIKEVASSSTGGAHTGIQITLDGSNRGLTVGASHFPFSLIRDVSHDLLSRSLSTSGIPGPLQHIGQIKRDCAIQRQLSSRTVQQISARSHQVEGERRERKAILLEDVPRDVENARGRKGKAAHNLKQQVIGKRIPPPARPSSAPASRTGLAPSASAPAGLNTISHTQPPSVTGTPQPRASAGQSVHAAQSGSSTPLPPGSQRNAPAGGKSPLLMKIVHRLAHKPHTLKDLSKIIGAPKPEISRLLSKASVAWSIGAAANPDNTVWSLKDAAWLDVDLFSPLAPAWTPADREKIYNETVAAFRRLGLPEDGKERLKLEEMWARARGVEPPVRVAGLGISHKPETPVKAETGAKPEKEKDTEKQVEKESVKSQPPSKPVSSSGPMVTSSGIAIGGTLTANFRPGMKTKESKASSKAASSAANGAKGKAEKTKNGQEAPRASEKTRDDIEEGEVEDESLSAPAPNKPSVAPAPGPVAPKKSKYPGSANITPSKTESSAGYDKPTVSSASKQKEKAVLKPSASAPKLDTPEKPLGTTRPSAARPAELARPTEVSRPASAAGTKPRPSEKEVKAKEPESKKRASEEDEDEHRLTKKRKMEDKLPAKRGEKSASSKITARDERVQAPLTSAPKEPKVGRKEVEEPARKIAGRKEDSSQERQERRDTVRRQDHLVEKKVASRKEDSSLERPLARKDDSSRERKPLAARKDDSSLERKPLTKEKKEALLAERERQRRAETVAKDGKKLESAADRKAAKRKQIDYSDDDETPAKKPKMAAAVKASEGHARSESTSSVHRGNSKVVVKTTTSNGVPTKREASRPAAADKGKRRQPDYTSSEGEQEEASKQPSTVTHRKPEGSSAPAPVIVDSKPPVPSVKSKPKAANEIKPRAPLSHGDLLVKSLRKYADYVEMHAKIVQQKQVYEDVLAGRRELGDSKLCDPEDMEDIIGEFQTAHTELTGLYQKMDELAASGSNSGAGTGPAAALKA